ncbi:hypothetical protein ZIOFF_039030 [Zingiber officinale]|uniref:Uncharacterized protein n=1 Tax=Zingiber officinale TaxID=94328 RepID=A0A8J5GAJ6_ZINOF|nr:hypothetical protein ZIOFF_039030 [Zingiber officinale]
MEHRLEYVAEASSAICREVVATAKRRISNSLEESRRYALGDDFERRMAVAENPFSTLYTRFCMNYVFVMDTGQTSSGIRQGDVVLKQDGNMDSDLTKRENFSIEDSCGDEELKVRTCGMSFITLGINTRTGMFLLRASKNVPSPFTLVDFEVPLNQGSLSATEVYDHH